MMNDKKTDVQVHMLPATGMRDIHRQYGLWIIRGCMNGKTPPDSFEYCGERYFQFYSISHMYDGGGRLWLKESGQTGEIYPGDCVIVTPYTVNRYGGARGKSYFEDCLNFCGPVADMLLRSGVISNGIFHLGKVRRLIPILEKVNDPAVSSQIQANIELQKLLVDIYSDKNSIRRQEYPLVDELLDAIREHPEKWWSVRDMAEMCNLSVDQLRRVFFQQTGVKPKIYVDRLKLNRAAEYLVSSSYPIAEVAEHFGYRDQYHFSRRFNAVMGVSPQSYRLSFSLLNGTQSVS
ncbi:MAG: helix-turn-helix transcriptional regulator [Lentisphaeria bacterium]|nr:helix-turn-helix transcriptional regulator [Lentisphaeria bacterium]